MTGDVSGFAPLAEPNASPLRPLRGPIAPHLLRDELLGEIFAAAVAARPGAPCIKTLTFTLTYGEVDARARALARGLLTKGVRAGDIVGLWAPRGPDLVIAQLAIAMTGAAWLPFDAEAPIARIATCLKDAGARLLLTSPDFATIVAPAVDCATISISDLPVAGDGPLVSARERGARAAHHAFVIYTSGSTGAPKGVPITNRNICHYLRAANEIYGVTNTDVVFQGASAAFDMSVEEIWLAFLAGAALFVASPEIVAETESLPAILEQAGVTVLDTAPTLLGVLPRDASCLRIIILGGEACPPSVAERWSREGLRIFNTYGPTETTVVATIAEVRRDEPVTIGKPIPNCFCYVVDDAMRLLAPGIEGELLIGGPGVAPGYLNRAALTAEKFIPNPFECDGGDALLYRTGDAVLIDEKGDLVFRGRIDDQVKIRGFRVELGEIEAALMRARKIRQAAVVLRKEAGLDALVAFLVTAGEAPDAPELRAGLRKTLPPYMIPSRYEFLDNLPRLVSGKIDRRTLATTLLTRAAPTEEQEPPRDEIEAALLAAATRVMPPGPIPFDADFFVDLGGHSLLAARFVSLLRETPRFASVTLHDLYALRTLRALAQSLDGVSPPQQEASDLSFAPPPFLRRFLCGLAQVAALPFILSVVMAQWIGVFVAYRLNATLSVQIAALFAICICVNVATMLISIAGKWLVIGRTRPGRYPLWGVYFFRWWLAQRLIGLTPTCWFRGAPLMRLYLRALGAKIGEDALIADLRMSAIDLVSIGAGASLGSRVTLANARVEAGELVIGAIDIGADACIGASCVIEEDVVIGPGAALEDLTALHAGARVGAGEIRDGSPARYAGTVDQAALDPPARASGARRALLSALFGLLALVVPPLGALAVLPALWTFDHFAQLLPPAAHVLAAWPAALALVLASVALSLVCRWSILPRMRESAHSVWSIFFLRKWAAVLAIETMQPTLSALFSTIYMRGWHRLMGAKIGKGSELATSLDGRFDLIDIGDDCFIADEASLGDERLRRGWMHLSRVKLGDRVFIGNDAVIPAGAELPRGALIGARSKPPADCGIAAGDTWFGSPPIRLPARETHDGGGDGWTYRPPLPRVALRAAYEALSVTLPAALFILFGAWAVERGAERLAAGDAAAAAGLLIRDSLLVPLGVPLAVIVTKWATMGRHRPQAQPMWSFWTMRTESSVVLYRGLARRALLDHLRGTPFLPMVLRLLGAKIGRGVFMDTTLMTEFDCVSIGDHCALNTQSALQTHLYEDRVMKVGRVTLGRGVTLGAGASVLPGAHVGDHARLGPLTGVMKGETIPANSAWRGAPAQRAAQA